MAETIIFESTTLRGLCSPVYQPTGELFVVNTSGEASYIVTNSAAHNRDSKFVSIIRDADGSVIKIEANGEPAPEPVCMLGPQCWPKAVAFDVTDPASMVLCVAGSGAVGSPDECAGIYRCQTKGPAEVFVSEYEGRPLAVRHLSTRMSFYVNYRLQGPAGAVYDDAGALFFTDAGAHGTRASCLAKGGTLFKVSAEPSVASAAAVGAGAVVQPQLVLRPLCDLGSLSFPTAVALLPGQQVQSTHFMWTTLGLQQFVCSIS
jgi:hypothetical protein